MHDSFNVLLNEKVSNYKMTYYRGIHNNIMIIVLCIKIILLCEYLT